VAGSVLAACSSGDGTASPTSRSERTTTTIAAPEPELLDAGAAPRRRLRAALTEGARARAALTVDVGVDQHGEGAEAAIDPPPITEVVDFRVGRVSATDATVSFRFAEVRAARVGTQLSDVEHLELNASLQQLVGVAGTGRVDDRSAPGKVAYDLPAGLDAGVATHLRDAEQQFAGLAVPLPADPVGVGARWRASDQVVAGGITFRRTATYEVTSLDGRLVGYTATVTQEAVPGRLETPDPTAGTTYTVVSATGSGTTRGTLDLSSPVSAARASTHVHSVLRRDTAAGSTDLDQDLTVAVAIRLQP
jgi:hypothetical protein